MSAAPRARGAAVRDLFRTSTFRLAAFYFGLFATSVLVLLAAIYWQTVVYAERQANETIDAEISGLNEQYRQRGFDGLITIINERSDPERGSVMLYLLVDESGRALAGNLTQWPDARVDPDGWMRFSLAPTGEKTNFLGRRHEAQATSFLLAHGYQLLVGRDMAELYAFRQRIILALGWAAGITLCLGLAGGIVMSRGALGRIEAINRASQDLIAGETSRRIPVSGSGDEFDRLAINLNTMLDRINRLMDGMREVTDNIAHDLRSPLGRLRSRIEVALRDPPSLDRYRVELERTIEEADQLLATFTALLEIAEAETGTLPAVLSPLDAAELVRDLGDLYEPVAEEHDLSMNVSAPRGPAMIRGNKQLLSRALANLIENAIKYTNPGGGIALGLSLDGPDIRITVADTGPGIPEEARERVFDRFYRLESSRTTQGNGLGLSLVRAILKLHGGSVTLSDNRADKTLPGLKATIIIRGLSPTSSARNDLAATMVGSTA